MANETLVHEGITYRKVNRKANVGEKVLVLDGNQGVGFETGEVFTVAETEFLYPAVGNEEFDNVLEGNYAVLEPAEDSLTLTEADVRNNPRQVIDLLANLAGRLTKAESTIERLDKRIDDEAFLSDEWADEIDDRIDRLASANEQAITTVARNVETWAQEFENFKHSPAPWATQEEVVDLAKKVADIDERTQPYQQAHELFVKIAGEMNGRGLTAEERREL